MPKCGHVALAGAPNVGKSTLLNALVGEHLAIVSPKPQATRLPVVGVRTDPETQFIFHDLPGLLEPAYTLQSRMRQAAMETLGRVHVVLHLHPVSDWPGQDFTTMAGLEKPLQVPVITVYTKADLGREMENGERGTGGLLISATSGQGLDSLLEQIRSYLPEGPFQFDTEQVGTQPVRFFVGEYIREAAFELLGDEVPYSVTAQVEEFRETKQPIYIRVTIFVERESQKGIVVGRGGETLKAIGSHARARMESLLGESVYLDSWVKVAPNWRRDPAQLTRLGFPE